MKAREYEYEAQRKAQHKHRYHIWLFGIVGEHCLERLGLAEYSNARAYGEYRADEHGSRSSVLRYFSKAVLLLAELLLRHVNDRFYSGVEQLAHNNYRVGNKYYRKLSTRDLKEVVDEPMR